MSFRFGDFDLDQERHLLLRSGRPVPLEPKAYELLVLLLERRPRALSRAQIRDVVWSGVVISESTLGGVVTSIRQALDDDPRRPRFIRTVHGFGYAFCGEVHGAGGERAEGAPVAPSLVEAEERGPYPGLRPFGEGDARVFFGREQEISALWDKLAHGSFLALIGPSGAGKTSFVQAGVVATRPAGCATLVCAPGAAPTRSLARALAPELAGDPEALAALPDSLDPDVLGSLMARWRSDRREALLVVDQFEELFTQNPPEVQEQFAALLGRLAHDPALHVLLSLRDDFLIRCHEHRALRPVFKDLTPLLPLGGRELRRALEEPARRYGYRFEDEALLDEMVEAAEGARAPLPLLAFAASRLWARRDRERSTLTRVAYEEIGGVAGALAQHAEQTMERIGAHRSALVRELFRNLVTAQGTRAAKPREELISVFDRTDTGDGAPAATRGEAEDILEALVDARLLTTYERAAENGGSRQQVEIAHESLLSTWPRLVRWRAQDEEGAVLRDQLHQAAQLWEEKGRPDDLLWRGSSYRELTLWRERHPVRLAARERAFAQAATQLNGRRRRRRRFAAAGLVALALGVAAVTSFLWHQAEAETRRAEAAEVLALGRLRLEERPIAGVAYALASLELADTPAARRFAVEALGHHPTAFVIPVNSQRVDLSHDGLWLATGGTASGVQLWAHDGSPPITLAGSVGVPDVQFDPLGPLLAVRDSETLRVFSIPDPQPIDEIDAEGIDGLLREAHLLTFLAGPRSSTVEVRPAGGDDVRVLGRWDNDGVAWWDVSSDGDWLAYARDKMVFLLPLAHLDTPPRLVGVHPTTVGRVAFAPGDDRLVSSDASAEIRIWSIDGDTSTLERTIRSGLTRTSPGKQPWGPISVLDRRGATLVAHRGGFDTPVKMAPRVWDLTGPPDAEPIVLREADVPILHQMALDLTGSWLATAYDGTTVVWALRPGQGRILRGQAPPFIEVAFTADGRWLASDSQECILRLWPLSPDVASGRRILIQEGTYSPRMAISPDGRNILVISKEPGRALLVPLDGGPPRRLRRLSSAWLDSPAISRDGHFAAAGSRLRPEGNVIEVWDLRSDEIRELDPRFPTEKECGSGPHLESAVLDVEFTSDGHLLSAGLSGLRLWNLDDGTNVLLRPCADGPGMPYLAGSPEDRYLLVERDETRKTSALSFHDLRAGVSRELTSHGNSVYSVALDPTGEIAVTGGWDGLVRVGGVNDEEPHLLYGHDLEVTSVAVSPDGRWIASGSQDGTIRLWPMPSGRPLHTLPYETLLQWLRASTNLRLVEDPGSLTRYRVDPGPFPGWAKVAAR